MGVLLLVRHGQGSMDTSDYDQLVPSWSPSSTMLRREVPRVRLVYRDRAWGACRHRRAVYDHDDRGRRPGRLVPGDRPRGHGRGDRRPGGRARRPGLRPVLGWSTHPHWDHVLWHASLGDVPRYATPAAAAAARNERGKLAAAAGKSAPGHDLSLIGKVTPLSGTPIAWDGPAAELVVHDGHAPGHAAVFLPDSGVLIAGDMCSDIEMQ